MQPILALILFISAACMGNAAEQHKEDAETTLKYLSQHITALTRQTMLIQFFTEQRVRTEGQSGLKLIRQRRAGTKNYFTESHTGYSTAAIHDHANNIRTVGMGEFTAVLNGIEFTTRHNDYRLKMPHTTSKEYGAVENVPFPDVPPEVLNKKTIQDQVDEMREWFKAWIEQDYSKRDYRKYFKPTLCYLEGAWTTTGKDIDEPFGSDRHFIDASTWMELHDKLRFTSYSGSKSRLENLSFLPTKIMGLKNETIPVFAQWNYRILCQPLKKDIPLNRLRVVDDISSRMMTSHNIYRYMHSRAARFQLNTKDTKEFYDRPIANTGLLDELMAEIPGKDNHQGNLTDEGLDSTCMNDDGTVKDVSRYHRWYKVSGRDAMGTSKIHRGYSDDFMFAAMNTQAKVAGLKLEKCKNKKRKDTCRSLEQKWSYAIPLELIYLTPLSNWNPYNLQYHGEHGNSRKGGGKIAQKDGRYGDCAKGKELNGTTSKLYYITPQEFYSGGLVGGTTAADTTRGVTCVLDKQGVSHKVRAAGTHVFLPSIKGVGSLRQRYPIFPVHGEGSSVWKELNALKDIYMNNMEHMKYSKEEMEKETGKITELSMGASNSAHTSMHTHDVELNDFEVSQLKGGIDVHKLTSTANGHQHNLIIRRNTKNGFYYYYRCDNKSLCFDKHARKFKIIESGADNSL